MRNVIRLGDTTSHGGKVVSSSAAHFKVHSVRWRAWATPAAVPFLVTIAARL